MDWFRELVAKHTNPEGQVAVEGLLGEFNSVFALHAVPKAVFNDKNDALKQATAALAEAQKSTGDVEAIKAQLAEAQKAAEQAEAMVAKTERDAAVREALRAAGGTDIDYLTYRLGDADGNLDNRIKDLVTELPGFFRSGEPKADEPKGEPDKPSGYRPLDNGLVDGKPRDEASTLREQVFTGFGLNSPPTTGGQNNG